MYPFNDSHTPLANKIAPHVASFLSKHMSTTCILQRYAPDPQRYAPDPKFIGVATSGLWAYTHLYTMTHKNTGDVLYCITGHGCRDEWMAEVQDIASPSDDTIQIVGHSCIMADVEVDSSMYLRFSTFIEYVNAYYKTIAHPVWHTGVFFTGNIHEDPDITNFGLVAVVPNNFDLGALAAISSFIRNALLSWALVSRPEALWNSKITNEVQPLIGGHYDVTALTQLLSNNNPELSVTFKNTQLSLWAYVFTLCTPIGNPRPANEIGTLISGIKEKLNQARIQPPHVLKNIYTPTFRISYSYNAYTVHSALISDRPKVYTKKTHQDFLNVVRDTQRVLKG